RAATTSAAVQANVGTLVQGGLRTLAGSRTPVRLLLLLAACLAGGVGLANSWRSEQETKPDAVSLKAERHEAKTGRYGDPLPPQAVARIGTVRWWHGHDRQGCPMVYAPDGKSLVSCDQDKGIRIVDTAIGRELRRIEVKGEPTSCFALSPDGKTIITGSWESPVLRQWNMATGNEVRQIATGAKGSSVLAFAPDGKTLAAVTEQIVIRLWDVATWQETRQLKGHTRWIGSIVFTPDGKTLVSGGGITDTMRWWDVVAGREIKRLKQKSRRYWELALSPDGKKLAAVMSPGVLYLWDAT